MMEFLLGPGRLVTARYYTGLIHSPTAQPFFRKLKQFGYTVVASSENPVTGKVAPVDQQLLTDLCLFKDTYEIANVVSGDGDFAYAIKRLVGDFGKRINIVAARHNTATALLAVADAYPESVQTLFLDQHSQRFVMRRVLRKR